MDRILEAMLSGRAVLITAYHDTEETISQDVRRRVIEANIAKLSEALDELDALKKQSEPAD